jgi:hypothetical protein
VLPVTANTVTAERGRLVLGVFHLPGGAEGLLRAALETACAGGIHAEDQRYSCASESPFHRLS